MRDFLLRDGGGLGGGDERELDSGSGDGEDREEGGDERVDVSDDAAGDAMLPL